MRYDDLIKTLYEVSQSARDWPELFRVAAEAIEDLQSTLVVVEVKDE